MRQHEIRKLKSFIVSCSFWFLRICHDICTEILSEISWLFVIFVMTFSPIGENVTTKVEKIHGINDNISKKCHDKGL